MLRIDDGGKTLVRLKESALAKAEHWERDLQSMIFASPAAFCEEIGEKLLLLGQEVKPSEAVPDRIDILAIDEAGNSVVIELKRGQHKLQLLQAISYAGMVSRWTPDRFVETLTLTSGDSAEDAGSAIDEHVGSETSAINQSQRVILIAEDFDPALLVSAEWLHDHHNVDIRCYRLLLSKEENGSHYLTCSCIYPPIEIATLTRGGGSSETNTGRTGTAYASWEEALSKITNASLKAFVRAELDRHQENRLRYREVIYRVAGRRRFYLNCKKQFAYIWQQGRFEGDVEYWRKRVSEPDEVKTVRNNRELRFYLSTSEDFAAFGASIKSDLPNIVFADPADTGAPDEEE